MKQLLLSLSFSLCSFAILAQDAALVLFTENGENFTAVLNGSKANEAPASRVRATDLNQEFYQVRIDFEDQALPDFNSNIALEKGMETTAIIKQNKKGRYVVRMYGTTALSSVEVEPVAEYVPLPSGSQEVIVEEEVVEVIPQTDNTSVTTTTTTTTKGTTTGTQSKDGVDIEMTVPGMDVKVKMDIPVLEMDVDMNVETEYTETVTTTTTTSGTQSKLSRPIEDVKEEEIAVAIPGYNGPIGCDWPVSDDSFESALTSIESKTFEDSKLTMAKQYAKSNCLKAAHVKAIMSTFDFEETKLDFAKFAYDFTYDKGNYYQVNDAFDFELTIDDLNEFLESK